MEWFQVIKKNLIEFQKYLIIATKLNVIKYKMVKFSIKKIFELCFIYY